MAEYTCASCKGVFEEGWSDEEAKAEKDALFPDVPIEHCDMVCDDCFNAMNDFFGFSPTPPTGAP